MRTFIVFSFGIFLMAQDCYSADSETQDLTSCGTLVNIESDLEVPIQLGCIDHKTSVEVVTVESEEMDEDY